MKEPNPIGLPGLWNASEGACLNLGTTRAAVTEVDSKWVHRQTPQRTHPKKFPSGLHISAFYNCFFVREETSRNCHSYLPYTSEQVVREVVVT